MNKILFLASWYPSRVNAFDGDFIERHAKSISLYNKVYVIYVVKDQNIKDGKIAIEKETSGNLVTYKAYYPYSNLNIGWVENFIPIGAGLSFINAFTKQLFMNTVNRILYI